MRWKNAQPLRSLGYEMIIKVVVLFLVGMMVLAMFGKLRLPKAPRLGAQKCDKCGKYRIGRGTCLCSKNRGS